MIKKKNKIVGLINIIFGVLMCADWYLFSQSARMDTITYWGFSENQELITTIGTIILAFPILTTLLINIIYTIKNWQNKKSMICNALTVITIIISGILDVVLKDYRFLFLVAIVSILGIILLVLNKNENEDKKYRLLFIAGIINIIVFIVSCVMFGIVLSAFDVHFENNQRNLIKNIMTLSDGKSENRPIKVKKNGKWGYIDNNGNIIVDFIYDDCAEFIEVEVTNNNKKYYIAPVLEGNKLSLITNENKTIGTFTNREKTSGLDCVGIIYEITENLKTNAKELDLKINLKNNEYARNTDLLNVKDKRYDYILGYTNGNQIIFEVEDKSNKEEFNNKLIYDITNKEYTYNNKKLNINGKIYIDTEKNILQIYKNGYIPICNFEKNIFGWIDLKGEIHYLNAKIQILDFIDNYILVKTYSDMNNKRICFINYQGNIVSKLYKEITILPNGYIVKKENNKNVYIDKQFKEITEEYDIIDGCRAEQGILIVANLPQNFENNFTNTLPSNLYFNIVNIDNIDSGKIVSNNIEYVNGMKTTKYEAKKYNSITDNEYKEILCSVDSEFANDEIYKQYYK